jgi:hypothetical protein
MLVTLQEANAVPRFRQDSGAAALNNVPHILLGSRYLLLHSPDRLLIFHGWFGEAVVFEGRVSRTSQV